MEEQEKETIGTDEQRKAEEALVASEASDMQAEEDAFQEEIEEEEEEEDPELGCQIRLKYKISPDQFFRFQMNTARKQIEKNKKRSILIGIVEMVFGVLYLAMLLLRFTTGSIWMYLICVMLIGVGAYSFVFYRYFFEKQLYKSAEKQHAKLDYFQNDIHLELYPNKCVERSKKLVNKTYWRSIWGVTHPGDAFYIMLNERSCLLVPKEPLGEQAAQVETFLRQICQDFEKTWKEL